MKNLLKVKSLSLWLVIGLLGVMAIGGVVVAYSGSAPKVVVEGDYIEASGVDNVGDGMLGATANRLPHGYWDTADGYYVDGVAIINGSGDIVNVDSLNYTEAYNEAGTSTLTTALSGTTYAITGAGPVFTLPATTSADGLVYRFVVSGAVSANATIVTSDGGNNIEGAMIVAGAVVDCDAEDTITFVADGENIGDFIELRLVNGYWMIGASGALTGSKLTCSAS